MKTVVRRYSKQLHVVLDNSSTHGTPDVKAWLAANPRVHFHYTPTSASWLNQVEGFFGILGKQSLGATDFYSKRACANTFTRTCARGIGTPPPSPGPSLPPPSSSHTVEC